MADKGLFGIFLESAFGIDINPKESESGSDASNGQSCKGCHYCEMDSSTYKYRCRFYFDNYSQDACDFMYDKKGIIGNEYDAEKEHYCSQRY